MESLDSHWQMPADEPLYLDEWELSSFGNVEDYFTPITRRVELPTTESNGSDNTKSKKKPRGRPRIHADPVTQTEVSPNLEVTLWYNENFAHYLFVYQHRRKQTRLAQRAYRDRQEDAFKVMKRNCTELEVLIQNVVGTVEELRKFVYGFAASRSRVQSVVDERFEKIVGDLSLLAVKSAEIQRATVPGSRYQNAGIRSNEAKNSTVDEVRTSGLSHEQGQGRDQALSQQDIQLRTIIGTASDRPIQQRIANQLSRRSSKDWFDPFGLMWLPKSDVPDIARSAVAESTKFLSSWSTSGSIDSYTVDVAMFANQLQLRALQRGYGLITGSKTPRSLLDQTFGHCIPGKSRTHIVHRVEYLMQYLSESCGNAIQEVGEPHWEMVADASVAPHNLIEDPWIRTDPSGAVVRYIGACDVSAYVLSKGYGGGDYVSSVTGSEVQISQFGSLGLKASSRSPDVGQLIEGEIGLQFGLVQSTILTYVTALSLVSIVLNHGPAFRKSDVDQLLNKMSIA